MNNLLHVATRSSGIFASRVFPKTSMMLVPKAGFARVTRGRKTGGTHKDEEDGQLVAPPPSATTDPSQAWTAVSDPHTQQVYWWNTVTNETTYLGAPKPLGPTLATSPNYVAVTGAPQQGGTIMQQQAPQQGGGMLSGLGSVMAQGFAFGTGSAVAHNVVGSMFGGSSGGSSDDSGSSDSGDSWEI